MPFIHLSSTVLAMALVAAPFRPLTSPQTAAGRIAGVVKDAASGNGIANANVQLVGTKHQTLTDASGAYRFESIPVASYTIAIRAVGYLPVTLSGQTVHAGRTTQLDFKLQSSVAQLEAIIVTGSAKRQDAGSPQPLTIQPYAPPVSITDGVRAARTREEYRIQRQPGDREQYDRIEENPFFAAGARPLSTFSIDVDRASYANVRRFLQSGRTPPRDAVRLEELINYFPYEYSGPRDDAPFAVNAEVGDAPWHAGHRLVRIGLQARHVDMANAPPANFVFLIDVSGSMQPPNKLPLLKQAFALLVEQLRPRDRVAIVVYAGSAGCVLPSTPGSNKAAILEALGRLESGGSTAGGEGIRRAYDEAIANFVRGGNNRVILATDGDFNVGVSSDAEMVRLIEQKRRSGVFLTVLGFGEGNLQDAKMEKIADHGNGNYAYIDNLLEARKVLVHELGGTLLTVAKDVKIQVEFNPAQVRAYRLIGYENRALADEDFADDRKDAGEIGSGHSVTALYEVIPAGVESDVRIRVPDSLRYQTPRIERRGDPGELLYVKMRYKAPDENTSRELRFPVRDHGRVAPSRDFRFQAAVAEFGLLLRDSEHRGRANWSRVIAAAREALGRDPQGYRAEFVHLAERAAALPLLTSQDR